MSECRKFSCFTEERGATSTGPSEEFTASTEKAGLSCLPILSIAGYGVFYEEVSLNGEEKMRNKFNFRSVASQTTAVDPKDQNEYCDPNLYPVLKFEGLATKETILKAYEENERKKQHLQAEKEKKDNWIQTDLQDLVKKIGRRELVFQDGAPVSYFETMQKECWIKRCLKPI
ncbi:hypothetical protein AVEN_253274-1 [Araneus ventricosus]|uniref:Uncharacterized protein n=1 Tax=Araneus ventricosus TaxID=182803 RepID=A0A4Y2SHS8_ARAVE|nr:hypothetical protein AVEN_253274-1 [Araneus ventricosus]